MKKRLLSFIIGAIMLVSCAGMTACGNKESIKDGKTITVKVFKAGYGTAWIYKAKEKFEEVYKSEGYKVNILKPDNSLKGNTALADMRTGTKSGVDLYFIQSVSVANAIDAEYGSCAEDLTDMYNLPAISFDGTEEDVKISQKLSATYNESVKSDDKYYSFLWASSPCGLVANTKVLQKYGLEIPKTTDELFNCFSVIYNGTGTIKGSAQSGVYPFAWAGNNAYGYAMFSLYANLGQILGQENYNKFISLQEGSEITDNDVKNGKSMYDNDDIYSSLEIMMREFNTKTAYPGSVADTHDTAHYNLLTGKCAFIPDGEFFFSEAKVNYEQYINDITIVNIPVNSDLGVKLKLDGSGNDRAKCDEVLSYVIDLIDQNKTNEEIIFAAGNDKEAEITPEQIEAIKEARGCYYERKDHNAYITKGSPVADIAKLFLRMCASDDFGDLFNTTAYGYAPYSRNNSVNSDYRFVNDCFKIVNHENAWGVSQLDVSGLRLKTNFALYEPYGIDIVRSLCQTNCTFASAEHTADNDFVKTKKTIQNKVYSVWNERMSKAGFNV